jgi:hypothetical protein
MPARAFSSSKLARPNWKRSAFGGLYAKALHVIPATVDGGDDGRKSNLKVRENLSRCLGEDTEFDRTVGLLVNAKKRRKGGGDGRASPAVLMHVG